MDQAGLVGARRIDSPNVFRHRRAPLAEQPGLATVFPQCREAASRAKAAFHDVPSTRPMADGLEFHAALLERIQDPEPRLIESGGVRSAGLAACQPLTARLRARDMA